jgi:hypothetical protein
MRMTSIGCAPHRLTLTPLSPGPEPKTSNSTASVTAPASGMPVANRNRGFSKSSADTQTIAAHAIPTAMATLSAASVSRSGSRIDSIVIRLIPASS